MSGILSAEEQIQLDSEQQKQQDDFKMGVVAELFANGTAKITFDGESAASEKQYSYLASYTPKAGDRVLLAAVSGTYIILGKVNFNVSPPTPQPGAGSFTTLSTSGKATLASLEVTGAATFNDPVTITDTCKFTSYIGFYGTTPVAKKTCYYAANETAATLRQRLNELIQRLGEYGLISPSN